MITFYKMSNMYNEWCCHRIKALSQCLKEQYYLALRLETFYLPLRRGHMRGEERQVHVWLSGAFIRVWLMTCSAGGYDSLLMNYVRRTRTT